MHDKDFVDVLTGWLVDHVTQVEHSAERVREHLLAECRRRRLEPPTIGRVDRIVRSTLSRGEDVLCARASRLSDELIREFKRGTDKENLLFRVAEATVDAGDELVRDTVWPVPLRALLRDLLVLLT
jgi:hypothetical protein